MAEKKSILRSQIDMTQGVPWKQLVLFSLPLFLGNVIQQLYNTVDSVVVGNYIGYQALAAVGTTFPIIMLMLTLFMGISTGAGVMISQYYGARDERALQKTFNNALSITFILGIAISIIGYFVSPLLLRAINVPDELITVGVGEKTYQTTVLEMSNAYLKVVFLGTLGNMYYNMLSGILRGLGDSVTPLIFLVITSLLNIVLDIVFVAVLGMGVAGVAWATIISQLVSAIFAFIRIEFMRGMIRVRFPDMKPDAHILGQMIKLGIPMGVQSAIFSVANLFVQGLINGFGDIIIAGCNIAMRVDSFAMMPIMTFGMGITTFTGQNVGAGRLDRVQQGFKSGLYMTLGVAVVMTAMCLLLGRSIMYLFVQNSPETIDAGMRMINFVCTGYIAMAISNVLSGVMRGAGDALVPMLNAIVSTVIVRLPLAYLLRWWMESTGYVNPPDCIYISLLCAWLIGMLHLIYYYRKGTWKEKGLARRNGMNMPDIPEPSES